MRGFLWGIVGFALGLTMISALAVAQSEQDYRCILVTVTPIGTTGEIQPSPTFTPSPTMTLPPTMTQRPSLTPTATTVARITLTPSPTPIKTITPTSDWRDNEIWPTATKMAQAQQTQNAKWTAIPPGTVITPTEELGLPATAIPMKTYLVTYRDGMNLRADHSATSAQMGYLRYGQEIGIIEEVSDGGYWWGKGQVGGQWVWVALRQGSGFKFLEVKP